MLNKIKTTQALLIKTCPQVLEERKIHSPLASVVVVVDGTITSSVVAFGFIVVVAVLVNVVVVVALSVAFTVVALSVVLVNGDVVGNVVALLSAVLLVLAVVAAISTDIPVASGTSVCG